MLARSIEAGIEDRYDVMLDAQDELITKFMDETAEQIVGQSKPNRIKVTEDIFNLAMFGKLKDDDPESFQEQVKSRANLFTKARMNSAFYLERPKHASVNRTYLMEVAGSLSGNSAVEKYEGLTPLPNYYIHKEGTQVYAGEVVLPIYSVLTVTEPKEETEYQGPERGILCFANLARLRGKKLLKDFSYVIRDNIIWDTEVNKDDVDCYGVNSQYFSVLKEVILARDLLFDARQQDINSSN